MAVCAEFHFYLHGFINLLMQHCTHQTERWVPMWAFSPLLANRKGGGEELALSHLMFAPSSVLTHIKNDCEYRGVCI